ncbi:MAG: DNA recombination/repair protein RecA, partial [Kiritimatiellae bacterium]|nr:DNA recombination/repair protein RecA [Kiritimatiellia bacterium]
MNMNRIVTALDDVLKTIRKEFGEMSVLRLGDAADRSVEAVSTGALSLDLALGVGGVPKGRIVECYGHESSGKTTLALHVVANA